VIPLSTGTKHSFLTAYAKPALKRSGKMTMTFQIGERTMNKIIEAVRVAKVAHAGQRYGKQPYYYHLDQVASMALWLGYGETIVVGCLLHDTVEDTELSLQAIDDLFGRDVADIVYAVTDAKGESRAERKRKTYEKIRGNWNATIVKLIDRACNIIYSMPTNPQKLHMYIQEHDAFVDGILTPETFENEVQPARTAYFNAYNIANYSPQNPIR
jgi:(p)ppGpp synthase/HD superfamily hydrolase